MTHADARRTQRVTRLFFFALTRYSPYHFGVRKPDGGMATLATLIRNTCNELAELADIDNVDPTPFYNLSGMADNPRDEDFDAAQNVANRMRARAGRVVGDDPLEKASKHLQTILQDVETLVSSPIDAGAEWRATHSARAIEAVRQCGKHASEIAGAIDESASSVQSARSMAVHILPEFAEADDDEIVAPFEIVAVEIAGMLVEDEPAATATKTAPKKRLKKGEANAKVKEFIEDARRDDVRLAEVHKATCIPKSTILGTPFWKQYDKQAKAIREQNARIMRGNADRMEFDNG